MVTPHFFSTQEHPRVQRLQHFLENAFDSCRAHTHTGCSSLYNLASGKRPFEGYPTTKDHRQTRLFDSNLFNMRAMRFWSSRGRSSLLLAPLGYAGLSTLWTGSSSQAFVAPNAMRTVLKHPTSTSRVRARVRPRLLSMSSNSAMNPESFTEKAWEAMGRLPSLADANKAQVPVAWARKDRKKYTMQMTTREQSIEKRDELVCR